MNRNPDTTSMHSSGGALAALALLAALAVSTPHSARAGTVLTGSTSANGPFAVLVGGFGNTVNGFASGIVTGAFNNVTAGNSYIGCGNRNQVLLPSDSAAIVSGNDNVVTGVHGVVTGGTFNQAGGFASLIHGNFLQDGGNAGSVMFGDSDPFGLRAGMLGPLVNPTPDSFTGQFNRGYFLFTSDGQGTAITPDPNESAGLFAVPSGAGNSAGQDVLANVGINTTLRHSRSM